jgi:hypothetical protein
MGEISKRVREKRAHGSLGVTGGSLRNYKNIGTFRENFTQRPLL